MVPLYFEVEVQIEDAQPAKAKALDLCLQKSS